MEYREINLELIKRQGQVWLDELTLGAMKLELREPYVAEQIKALVFEVAGKIPVAKCYEVTLEVVREEPATWWEHFKRDVLGRKKRHRKETEIIKRKVELLAAFPEWFRYMPKEFQRQNVRFVVRTDDGNMFDPEPKVQT